jgi:pimeloyl-ACP methyl ester carboxylesterase
MPEKTITAGRDGGWGMTNTDRTTVAVGGTSVAVVHAGSGEPLVFLDCVDAESGGADWLPVHSRLAERFEVFNTVRPSPAAGGELATALDFAFFYREVLAGIGVARPHVVAVSAAGWFAAEMAIMCSDRFRSLVLVDAAGIRVPAEPPPDIFAMTLDRVRGLLFADAAHASPPDGPDLALRSRVRLMARIGWNPYLYDPKLEARLGQIGIPTLVAWGAEDRLFTPSYARAFGSAIPGARVVVLPGAGHLPSIERPAELARAISEFGGAVAA